MSETVIAALIAAGASVAVCMISNHFQSKRTLAQQREHQQEMVNIVVYRIEQLEKKQDKHNGVIERLYEVERKLGIDEEKISVANHRIDDLEKFHK